jgi:hypothetical protein
MQGEEEKESNGGYLVPVLFTVVLALIIAFRLACHHYFINREVADTCGTIYKIVSSDA